MKVLVGFLVATGVTLSFALAYAPVSKSPTRSAWNVHTLTGKLHVKKMLA